MASLQSVRQNEHPVLFLDIDGVLHPGNGIETGLLCRAKALEEALSDLNVRIVVSSSWRFHMEIDEILCQLPTDIARRVVGVTGTDGRLRCFSHCELAHLSLRISPASKISLTFL